MKKVSKAFTLTELLIALGVVAVLCAILIPIIYNMMPNPNILMAKRAFYTAQSVVSELINDEACYPDKTENPGDNKRIGFDDAEGSPNCIGWTGTDVNDDKATEKLVTLFTKKLGVDFSSGTNSYTFNTKDGMQWAFSDASWNHSSDNGGSIHLTVDVNGSSDPNCGEDGAYATELGSGDATKCSAMTKGFDRFQMVIYGDGGVDINGAETWAINAVKVNRNITSSNNSNAEDE